MYDPTKPYIPEIKRLIQTTWNTKYLKVDNRGVLRKYSAHNVEWRHTDGIGTKGQDHWRKRTFAAAVEDALANSFNDCARDRAIPLEICNHIFLPTDDHRAIIEIVSHLAEQCRAHDIAITGGEIAIHEGSKGLEISITMLGIKRSLEANQYRDGDVLIGIGSSGAHSNGFTKIHSVYDDWESLPDNITTPTLMYYDVVDGIDRMRMISIHGMTNITGGAFTKMKEQLGAHNAYIHRRHALTPHPIFGEMLARGVREEDMYRIFNCGIGFVIGVEARFVDACLFIIRQQFRAAVIGDVKVGTGDVHIQSMFSLEEFTY